VFDFAQQKGREGNGREGKGRKWADIPLSSVEAPDEELPSAAPLALPSEHPGRRRWERKPRERERVREREGVAAWEMKRKEVVGCWFLSPHRTGPTIETVQFI
jgi:hypothetical protein